MIKFAGIRSDDMNLVIEHYPSRTIPEHDYKVLTVPGRDGDIVIDECRFKNYRQTYSVFIESIDMETEMYQRILDRLSQWLLGNPGYQRLEDSYDPDFYRMAFYSGGQDFSNFFNVYGRGSLEFTCAPRRFYKSGEVKKTLNSGDTLISPSVFSASPIYEIAISGTYPSITVNNKTVTFLLNNGTQPESTTKQIALSSAASTLRAAGYDETFEALELLSEEYAAQFNKQTTSDKTLYVDVENHITTDNYGNRVALYYGEYDDLKLSKNNIISYNSSVDSLKITPRWWVL